MKKRLSLFLAVIMVLSLLSSCAVKPADNPEIPDAPAQSQEQEPEGQNPAEGTQTPDEKLPLEPEFHLRREEGCNLLTLYWKGAVDYSKCDVWMWWEGKDGSGYSFHPCEYGVKCQVNVPQGVSQVGFIVRTDCSEPGGASWGTANKDFAEDRFAVITGEDTVIYLKTGDGSQYTSEDGGKTLTQIKLFTLAGIVSPTEIRYFVTPAVSLAAKDDIKVTSGGRTVEVASLSALGNTTTTGVITLAEPVDVSRAYTVEIKGYGERPAVPTDIFDSQDFIDAYYYDGDDLGAVLSPDGKSTAFKVWAPTASQVKLNLFRSGSGGGAYEVLDMVRGEKGVWSASASCGHGTYYTYSVTTSVGTQEAVDPYARSAGVNGDRGMVVDMRALDPAPEPGVPDYYQGINSYEDAVIWEVHVRDFSNKLAASRYKGKFLAFTETGLKNSAGQAVGVDYLKNLGITHVHLQPIYDYATVDETRLNEPQFNWGYDPKNYNVPEGSYSTDPANGETRVSELKYAVRSLHREGIGVIMDVVYNHTYDINSSLNKIVPYYYYRYTASGAPANGSGCGNETASDRVMFRKFMVDSVKLWAEEYKIDGFRFDLMALHDVETMQAIETAVHEINPKAIIYGEGWTGGSTPLAASRQANQGNIKKIKPTGDAIGAVAVFNDAIRDGLKGSVFTSASQGYINGSASKDSAPKVAFGIKGGRKTEGVDWTVDNSMVINYMSAHDNNTLWDKLKMSNPSASEEELIRMNKLGISIVMISRGTPFFLAGEEMLRTKGGDENSYKSSDDVNNIDWEALKPGSKALEVMEFYRELIRLRRENDFLRQADASVRTLDGYALEVTWRFRGNVVAMAYINPGSEELSFSLPAGTWTVLLGGQGTLEGAGKAPGKSVLLVRK
ncbi:MAG: type I pullulanase [Oscillospiraceae bacterium]|nr:type I pullulanase [Oscillospiraceae bacterium]